MTSQPKRRKRPLRRRKRKNPTNIIWTPFDWRGLTPEPVIGLDEAGRGCLAGPVFAAAVILQSETDLDLLSDSKLVSEFRREKLFEIILSTHLVGVGVATAAEIDAINILQASFLAMRRALVALSVEAGHLIVDGHLPIPECSGFTQTPLIKGDLRCKPVSAASIVAKVSRDRWMRNLAKEFPRYGFEVHKGYPTELHRARIREHGACREHRLTFEGVRVPVRAPRTGRRSGAAPRPAIGRARRAVAGSSRVANRPSTR